MASDNEAVIRSGTLTNNKKYTLAITVLLKGKEVEIKSTLDGQPYVNWKGAQASLTLPWNDPPTHSPVVGAWKGETVFHAVKLKMLSGKSIKYK